MENKPDKYYKWKIGILAAVITVVWGFAGYSYFNPVEATLDEGQLAEIKEIIEGGCPRLTSEFNNRREPGNEMRMDIAKELITRCTAIMLTGKDPIPTDPFYDALVKEMERADVRYQ